MPLMDSFGPKPDKIHEATPAGRDERYSMKTLPRILLSVLVGGAACWLGTAASLGQSQANFAGNWNFAQFGTPARLTLITANTPVFGTNYFSVRDVPEKTNFMARMVPMTIDGSGNFSGPGNGVVTVAGPGLVQAVPAGESPVMFSVNAAQDLAFAANLPPGGSQQELMLMLKAPASLAAADLTGVWKMVTMGTAQALQLRWMTNYLDPQHPVDGVVELEGRSSFATGNGTLTVAADGSFSLVFGPDTMNGTATPGANGLVQVTIPMPPNPAMVLSFHVNAGKNVMAAVHTEPNYQEIIVAVKLPAAQTDGESQGLWHSGGLEIPGSLGLTTNSLGFVTDLPGRNNFAVHGEKIHIGHTSIFTAPKDRTVGRVSIVSPGTVQVAGTNDAGESFSTTLWCNAAKDFLIGTRADSSHELTLVARAPVESLAGPGEFGLMLVKTNQPPLRVDLYWASAANRALQMSTNPVNPASWADVAGTLGTHTHSPSLGSLPRAYYRVRHTTP